MRWLRQKRRRKVLFFLLFALGLYLAMCLVLARNYLHPWVPTAVRPPYLSVAKGGPEGTWVGGNPDAKAVFVLIHGYGANQEFWTPLAAELLERGHAVVIPAMPGHGLRGHDKTTFGHEESQVAVEAGRMARADFPHARVVLVGCSMGGAAAWLASERAPAVFDAVATEGAYARFDEAMSWWFERKMRGASITLRPVIWFATWSSGLTPSDIVPMDSARKWRGRPALVIQAEDDRLILRSHADRLAEAAGCELWLVPGARHAGVQEAALEEYADRLAAMLESGI